MDGIVILGVGMHPFGRFDQSYQELGRVAARRALADAQLAWRDVDAAFCASMYLPATAGIRILGALGRTGIPICDVEAACASGAVALRQGAAAIAAGTADTVLVLGTEKMPRGFMEPSMIYDQWQIDMGMAMNPAYWAMRARRHMHDYGTTEAQIARVAVKSHRNSVDNPFAMYRRALSFDEIMASAVVCDPIRLFEICAPNDGAAAIVLARKGRNATSTARAVTVAACTHSTARYSADFRSPVESMSSTTANPGPTRDASLAAYEEAGMGPGEVTCFEVQDTDAFCEIEAYEELGVCDAGEGGELVDSGRTQIGGDRPVNMSGGLISKGEPVGASHLGQIVELVTQLRGEAGRRQVHTATSGLAHVLGAGGHCAVTILKR
jgi:acetyl-CoA acetyltransferase